MTTINKHITEFLEYYLALQTPPEYAVMLRGTWGSGKTWFIKDFILHHKSLKFLNISLYGISSPSEVEDKLFELLHPWLSSKAVKISRKILTTALKTSLKIDLDGDKGSSDLTTTFSLPDFVKKFDNKAKNAILIFDDLERCSMPIADILGYINQYVEHYGLKVILLANEVELNSKEKTAISDKTTEYQRIKEKLIGKIFDIESDLGTACSIFLSNLTYDGLQKKLIQKRELIEKTYQTAGYNNLRHLKQSIMDFERFYSFLPPDVDQKEGLLDHLILMFFALSIELKKGDLTEDQVTHIFEMDYQVRLPKQEPTTVQIIAKKYEVFRRHQRPLDEKYFKAFFKRGFLDKAEISMAIRRSAYFLQDRLPPWAKMFEFESLDDDEFKDLLQEIFTSLRDEIKMDKYVFLHTVALFLHFVQVKLTAVKREEILNMADLAIERMKSNGCLLMPQGEKLNLNSAFGYSFYDNSSHDFQTVFKKLNAAILEVQIASLPKEALDLLRILKDGDAKLFITNLVLSNSITNRYFRTPILTILNPKDFVDAFLGLPNKKKPFFFEELAYRYHTNYLDELITEKAWWQRVLNVIKKRKLEIKNTVSGLHLNKAVDTISDMINAIK